jgi:hypothetical protein
MPPQNDHIFKVVFFPTEYSNKIYVRIYYSTMENASSTYYILLFVYHPAWQKAHIIKVLNKQFSQVRCYCLSLGFKNSTWHSVFKYPHTLFIHLTVRLPISHSYKTAGKYIHIISKFHIYTKQQWNIFTSYQYIQLSRNIHAHLVKTSGNFLQMQLHTKNSSVTQYFKVKICGFSF